MSASRTVQRARTATLFPELLPMAPDKVDPPAKTLRRAGHKRRLAEAAANAPAFVPPTLPCYHGWCRQTLGDGVGQGFGGRRWCPACPGHKRLRGGGVLCEHDEGGPS